MRCYYLNFTNYRFNNCQETSREKRNLHLIIHHEHVHLHNTAIHNRVFKIYETVNKTIFHVNLQIPRN